MKKRAAAREGCGPAAAQVAREFVRRSHNSHAAGRRGASSAWVVLAKMQRGGCLLAPSVHSCGGCRGARCAAVFLYSFAAASSSGSGAAGGGGSYEGTMTTPMVRRVLILQTNSFLYVTAVGMTFVPPAGKQETGSCSPPVVRGAYDGGAARRRRRPSKQGGGAEGQHPSIKHAKHFWWREEPAGSTKAKPPAADSSAGRMGG